jgi:hypothetical protein
MIKVSEMMEKAKQNADPLTMFEAAKAFAVDSRQLIANEQVHMEDLIAESKKASKVKSKP